MSKKSEILLYADYIKIYMSVNSLVDCNVLLESEVTNILRWWSAFRGTHIKRSTAVKDLGVHVDSVLSFDAHFPLNVGNATKMLDMISRMTKQFRNPACFIRLFCLLVRCRLEFGSVIWNSLSRTQSLIRIVDRLCLFTRFFLFLFCV